MTRSLPLALVAAALLSAADAAPQVRRRLEEEEEEAVGRIVSGTPAAAGQFPWFVLFESGACGGTLISPDRVLTSATCVINQNPSMVRVGASTTSDGVMVPVRCANIYPDYYRTESSIYNDVAILKLMYSVRGITPVTLNTDLAYPPFLEQQVTTMGFGFTSTGGPLSSTLRVASMELQSTFHCQENYPEMTIFETQHICALEDGLGVCTGDSGGPLLDGTTSTATQIGITSFTFGGCASDTFPDVFTRVAAYSGWIRSEITSNACLAEEATEHPSISPTAAPTASTPNPTPSPTKKDCFLDKLTDVLDGLLPFAGEAANTVNEQMQEDTTTSQGIFGWLNTLLSGGETSQEQQQDDNQGGNKDKDKGGKDKGGKGGKNEEKVSGIYVGAAQGSGGP